MNLGVEEVPSRSSASRDFSSAATCKWAADTAESADDEEPSEMDVLTRSVFLNTVIAGMIFGMLSARELLTLSTVSKWMLAEVRAYMRSRRKCIALVAHRSPCERLTKLEETMTAARVSGDRPLPFNGLHIKVAPRYFWGVSKRVPPCGNLNVDVLYPEILSYRPLQYLSFDIMDEDHFSPCPAFALFVKLIQSTADELVHITLANVPRSIKVCDFLPPDLLRSLPKLRSLDVGIKLDDHQCLRPLATRMVDAAAAIADISVHIHDLHLVAARRISSVSGLYVHCSKRQQQGNPTFPSIAPLLTEKDAYVRRIVVKQCSSSDSEPLLRLLANLRNSLEELSIRDWECWIPEQLPVLPKLKILEAIDIKAQKFREAMAGSIGLKFPALESLTLAQFNRPCSFYHRAADLSHRSDHHWLELFSHSPRQPCEKLLNLTLMLDFSLVSIHLLDSFAPHVKTLELIPNASMNSDPDIHSSLCWLYEGVWGLWPGLEELRIQDSEAPWARLSDADVCGIAPEEVQYLQGCSDDFLQQVHIVPIRPALTTMLQLKRLEITHVQPTLWSTDIQKWTLLSKVACYCAFRPSPQLAVTIRCPGLSRKCVPAWQKVFPGSLIKTSHTLAQSRHPAITLDMTRR